MAKVYEFPIKTNELPDEVKECLYEIGKAYLMTLNYALTEFCSDNPTHEELEGIRNLVTKAYVEGLDRAFEELEKGL